jgi:hypothetical protein
MKGVSLSVAWNVLLAAPHFYNLYKNFHRTSWKLLAKIKKHTTTIAVAALL